MSEITIEVGEKELNFNVEVDDFNKFVNEQMPNDKVKPAYNFLIRTITDDDKDKFKEVALVNGKPNGLIVMQIAGFLTGEFGGDIEISIKKPS